MTLIKESRVCRKILQHESLSEPFKLARDKRVYWFIYFSTRNRQVWAKYLLFSCKPDSDRNFCTFTKIVAHGEEYALEIDTFLTSLCFVQIAFNDDLRSDSLYYVSNKCSIKCVESNGFRLVIVCYQDYTIKRDGAYYSGQLWWKMAHSLAVKSQLRPYNTKWS